MSKDDPASGFLAKVVKFVRNPTASWGDLDTRIADRENDHSNTARKELIARKRRGDFVRKREFDALRKIRNREAADTSRPSVRPSFFQSSLSFNTDERAMTLKKIDDIEAQMSMQWWKTKSTDSLVSTITGYDTSGRSTGSMPPSRHEGEPTKTSAEPPTLRRKKPHKNTEIMPLQADPGISSQPQAAQSVSRAAPSAVPSQSARGGLVAPTVPAEMPPPHAESPASHFYTQGVQEITLNPDVEEASIRFASGDDAGAEQGLLEALRGEAARSNQVDDWLTLFDLYRATGQLTPFESRAVDFVNRFGRSAPQWHDLAEQVSALSGKASKVSGGLGRNRAAWVCEPDVDAHALGTLQNVLLRTPQPWVLDWASVKTIDGEAVPVLLGTFTLWGDQDIELRFLGAAELREILKATTPLGRRDIDPIWWKLRMAVLRVMNRPEEFELTALDFCVTYEVSPPGWEPPRCHFQGLSADPSGDGGWVSAEVVLEHAPSKHASDSGLDGQGSEVNHLGLVELSGEIRGDPQDTIDLLEQRLQGADVMIISCCNLIRVDFSAAGSLLNWVVGHHATGRTIQFVDVHRLVSAFFHVIGITEYAKVVVRND